MDLWSIDLWITSTLLDFGFSVNFHSNTTDMQLSNTQKPFTAFHTTAGCKRARTPDILMPHIKPKAFVRLYQARANLVASLSELFRWIQLLPIKVNDEVPKKKRVARITAKFSTKQFKIQHKILIRRTTYPARL
mmetsp:Transcript_8288/g.13440  ORF Transcript_8288/g.13440 Transcript_8288/m.13440 type:complete len:134 (-) Transcript_8288:668-1069(-)